MLRNPWPPKGPVPNPQDPLTPRAAPGKSAMNTVSVCPSSCASISCSCWRHGERSTSSGSSHGVGVHGDHGARTRSTRGSTSLGGQGINTLQPPQILWDHRTHGVGSTGTTTGPPVQTNHRHPHLSPVFPQTLLVSSPTSAGSSSTHSWGPTAPTPAPAVGPPPCAAKPPPRPVSPKTPRIPAEPHVSPARSRVPQSPAATAPTARGAPGLTCPSPDPLQAPTAPVLSPTSAGSAR